MRRPTRISRHGKKYELENDKTTLPAFSPPDGGITFATNLVNGVKQPDGGVKCLTPRQVGDLLGHSTSQITEMYYVKRDNSRLIGITDSLEI